MQEGEAERNEGMDRALSGSPDFKRAFAIHVASLPVTFKGTIDDIMSSYQGPMPRNKNAIGAGVAAAEIRGHIKKTGKMIHSTKKSRHANRVYEYFSVPDPLWRSILGVN
jgi:hypothetical protein